MSDASCTRLLYIDISSNKQIDPRLSMQTSVAAGSNSPTLQYSSDIVDIEIQVGHTMVYTISCSAGT